MAGWIHMDHLLPKHQQILLTHIGIDGGPTLRGKEGLVSRNRNDIGMTGQNPEAPLFGLDHTHSSFPLWPPGIPVHGLVFTQPVKKGVGHTIFEGFGLQKTD